MVVNGANEPVYFGVFCLLAFYGFGCLLRTVWTGGMMVWCCTASWLCQRESQPVSKESTSSPDVQEHQSGSQPTGDCIVESLTDCRKLPDPSSHSIVNLKVPLVMHCLSDIGNRRVHLLRDCQHVRGRTCYQVEVCQSCVKKVK